jgi:Uma2 family endonuclease
MPMPIIQKTRKMNEVEYLEFERASETKHEFFNGEIFAMAGASEEHDTICMNLAATLLPQVRKNGCKVHSSDMRLKVLETGLYTYPDISIYCLDLVFTGDRPDTLTNPSIIFEVLSPSTEIHDRNTKFRHYQQIPSLQEYVLVAQDKPRIERFMRQKDSLWLYQDVDGIDGKIEFATVGAVLELANAYEQVTFPEEPDS